MSVEAIYTRRSIRKFLPTPPPPELLEKVLLAGRAAPSGKNRQPWRFIVLDGAEKARFLEAMAQGLLRERNEQALLPASAAGLPSAIQTLRIMRKAPVLIAVLNANGKSPFAPLSSDERFAEIVDTLSIGAAIENMLLEAESLHLGALWIANTCFAYPELTEALNTPDQLVGAVALGYAGEAPDARPRKALSEIVEYRR